MADTYIFGQMTLKMFNKEIDLLADTIKCMLVYDSVSINRHTNEYISELSTYEISGDNYSSGGNTLTNVVNTYSNPTMTFNADDLIWAEATFSTRYGIVYVDTGLETTSPLMCYIDFAGNQSVNNADFEISWDDNGIFTATV